MSLSATISPGPAAGAAELRAALANAQVVFLADERPVEQLAVALADPAYEVESLVIGRAQLVVNGRDGCFEPAFQTGIQAGHIDADGMMDFLDRELLKPVSEGACVGLLHQPHPGTPGKRVDGSELEAQAGQPSKLRVGSSLRVDASGRVYALCSGVVKYVPESTLDIVQHFVHPVDVDLRSGNLDMQGALTIRGTVQRPFSVRASGDVEIYGNVENGSVFAGAGVRIRGTARSGDCGKIYAAGDIRLRNAEGAHVNAGGRLTLDTAINSELSGVTIQIAQRVRGGSAQAELCVSVQEAVAGHGGTTLLAAGIPLQHGVDAMQAKLAASKEQRRIQHQAGVRGEGERAKAGKLGRAAAGLQADALAHKVTIARRRAQLLSTAFVQFLGTGQSGIAVQIGQYTLTLERPVSNVRFAFDPFTGSIRSQGVR